MSKNDPNDQAETLSSIEGENTFHNPERLLRLTAWSGILAWVFFATGAALIIVDLIFIIQSLPNIRSDIIFIIVLSLVIFVFGLICLFFGWFARIVSEGIFLVMDIEDNTRRE